MLKWRKKGTEKDTTMTENNDREDVQEPAVEDRYWEKLETPKERKQRIISLFIVHTAMLVFALGFSIVLTGLQPYLKHLTGLHDDDILSLFGWMVAINPIGQFVFSPIFGWLSNRFGSIRMICLITCLIYIGGNVLYSSISLIPLNSGDQQGVARYSLMFVARLLIGISSANQAPIRAYVAGATWKHERNLHISILSLFQSLGFMIGPAIQSGLTPIGYSETYEEGKLKFDMYTVAGWLSAGVGIVSFILFLPGIFTESYVAIKEREHLKHVDTTQSAELIRPDLWAIISTTLSFFVFLFNFILLETIGTPLCMEQLGWDEEKSITQLGILMSVGAVISMIAYASVSPITRRIDERLVYIFLGLVPMAIGRIVMLPMGSEYPILKNCSITEPEEPEHLLSMYMMRELRSSGEGGCCVDDLPWCEEIPRITEPQFYVGYIISAISFPYCMAICQAVFSKVIGPRPQGLWMGLLTSVGSLARITGPIFVSAIYVNYGTYWTFGLCAGTLGLALVVTTLTYFRLVPIEDRMAKLNLQDQDQLTKL